MELPDELKPGPLEMLGLWKAARYLKRAKEALVADLKNQPTAAPSRKVVAAGGGGLTAALLIWVAVKFLGVELGAEDAAVIASALAVVAGYFFRERAPSPPTLVQR